MKPLSIFTYYLNNKRKVIPATLIIGLSVLGITATAAFTGAINRDIEVQLSIYSYLSTLEAKDVASPVDLDMYSKELETDPSVAAVYKGERISTNMDALLGASYASVYVLDSSGSQAFLDALDWKLIQGRMPTQANEVVLTQDLLEVKNAQAGDAIGSEVLEEEALPGKYIIVGSLSTPQPQAGGIAFLPNQQQVSILYIFPKPEQENQLEATLQKYREENPDLEVMTAQIIQQRLQEEFQTLDFILWGINAVSILVIALSIGLINIIFFMQRANEFGLLAALGYSRLKIVTKTFLESIGMVIMGWGSGVLFAELVYKILNQTIFSSSIYGLTVFEVRTLLFSLPVPIAVIVFSCATVLWKLLRLDPIAIIEKRD